MFSVEKNIANPRNIFQKGLAISNEVWYNILRCDRYRRLHGTIEYGGVSKWS